MKGDHQGPLSSISMELLNLRNRFKMRLRLSKRFFDSLKNPLKPFGSKGFC